MPDESEHAQIKRLVEQATELLGWERRAFLDARCPPELRERVQSILARLEDPTPEVLRPAESVLHDISGAEDPVSPQETIGSYRVVKRIGQGGMAVVYLAEHTRLRHRVAIKVLPRLFVQSPERVARFRAEAKVAANLKHRNIVAVHDVGESGDVEYLVMDHVDGPTLAQDIEYARLAGRDLSERSFIHRQVRIAIGIADALHCAHGLGIVHRDVKPSNVLLEDGEARLTDFGIAKSLNDPSTTATGHIVGSIAYMSPEQAMAASADTDTRSDIFSLGVVLYEMLSFVQPFRATSVEQSLRNVVDKEPDRLRRLNPGASPELEVICAKAMEKDPEHRYQSAAHMAGDLRCCLEGRPILARRAGAFRKLALAARRHRAPLRIAIVTALVVLLTGMLWNDLQRQLADNCQLQVQSPGDAILVRLSRFNQRFALEDVATLASGTQSVSIEPGHYRITCATGTGSLTEVSVLAQAGTTVQLVLEPRQLGDDDLDAMVRIEGDASTPPFFIDKLETSNAEYLAFVRATDRAPPIPWAGEIPDGDLPVVGITFRDAQAYAQWRGKRLPTAHEWTLAMQAPDGRRLPWGQRDFEWPDVAMEDRDAVSAARFGSSFLASLRNSRPVDSHPEYATPLGILHGASNVREYTDTTADLDRVMVKGAGWADSPEVHDTDHAWWRPIVSTTKAGDRVPSWSVQVGFRCARTVRPE